MKCKSATKYEIPNLKNAFMILDYLRRTGTQHSLSEIAKGVKIPCTTTLRILSTMCDCNAVEKINKKYKIGKFIFDIADSMRTRSDLGEKISPFLVRLTAQTKETSHLCIANLDGAIVLRECSTWQSLRSISTEGSQINLTCSSAGKILLADKISTEPNILKNIKITTRTPNSIKTKTNLIKELNNVAEQGWAIDNEEYELGAKCVSVPVRDDSNILIGALGITAPSVRMGESQIKKFVQILKETADDFSKSNKRFLNAISAREQ
jgi:DNA-binding IclR family transcriptional regulator